MSIKPLTLLGFATLVPLIGCGNEERSTRSIATADSAALIFFSASGNAGAMAEIGLLDAQVPSLGGLAAPPGVATPTALLGMALQTAHLATPRLAPLLIECHPIVDGVDSAGAAIDSDGDGIPDDLLVDLGEACVTADSGGSFRATSSGSVRVQDTDLGFRSFHVTVDHIQVVVEDFVTGVTTTGSSNGTETGRFTSTLAERSLFLAVSSRTVSRGVVFDDTNNVVRIAEYTPDPGEHLALGARLPPGHLDFQAALHVVNGFGGGDFNFLFETPTPLHYEPGCTGKFDAGRFRGLLNGESTTGFELLWNGCTAPALTLFGNVGGSEGT